MFTGEKNEPNDVWLSIMQALNNITETLCISLAMLHSLVWKIITI